nr:2-oxoacid:acceptor oxidoreductase family protein [Nitrospirota bacterium]
MSPFTAWLPVGSERTSDLVLKIVGTTTAGLLNGATALEQALTEQGLRVMAQTSPSGGRSGSAVRLRVSTEPITSLGSGCDVVACMDRAALQQQWFDLQPGSVFVHEAGADAAAVPDGVIAYAVPFSDLHRRCGARFSGKGLIAAGVLAHLLGIPERIVRSRIRPHVGLRYFDAGVGFASSHLEKRDIYVTPSPAGAPRQIMLDAHQALLLGLTIGGCDCRTACAQSLDRTPHEWMAEHVRAARGQVSTLAHQETSCLHVDRGSDGEVMALLGAADPSAVPEQGANRPRVLVAADMLDAIRLVGLARREGRANPGAVWVVVDEILAARRQSVPVEQLVGIVAGTAQDPENKVSPSLEWRPDAEWDRDPGATIGYVAWGAAQGVVREAVTLCRSFGLNVSALYPNVLWPAPTRELEAFAETVEHVIIVEPDRAGRYTRFIRNWTSLPAVTVMPEPGRALTPMDIFMREGLGA